MKAATEAQFDPVYWASKSPEILAMVAQIKAAKTTQSRTAIAEQTAQLLAEAGRTGQADLVDNAIMVWGWGPFYTMLLREQYGDATVPDGTNTQQIKVSTDLADYPAYGGAPTPVPVPAPASLVGNGSGGFFIALQPQAGQTLKDGESYTDPSGRGAFIYHSVLTPFGSETWFTAVKS